MPLSLARLNGPAVGFRRASTLCLLLAACGSSTPTVALMGHPDGGPSADASAAPASDAAATPAPDGGTALPPNTSGFTLDPDADTLELADVPLPTLTFTLKQEGVAVDKPQYVIDRPELGSIDRATGVFVPKGPGGKVQITATSPDGFAVTTLNLVVRREENGDSERQNLVQGAGGIGGVGGEGGGTPVTDAAVRSALDSPATEDTSLQWIYPYDGTIWPQGLPAPMLAWRSPIHRAVAVRLRVEVDDVFSHTVYISPPEALPPTRDFTHVPMPAAVWRTGIASGSTMRVSLVVVSDDGAGGYASFRPSADLTWTIASSGLKGTVYYNSYGTALVKNYSGAVAGDGRFGGAVLGVRGDSFEPTLIAGTTTRDNSGCRVCHTVSGDGSTMLAQGSDSDQTSAYDLRNANAETPKPATDNGKFAWAALSWDGRVALGASGPPLSTAARSNLYDVATGNTLNSPGFAPAVTRAVTPSFSPDGSLLAFNYYAGTAPAGMTANGHTLALFDVAATNPTTYTFANLRALYSSAQYPPGWPTFMPGNRGVIFERELAQSTSRNSFETRYGARGDLWWTDLTGNAHALDLANGTGLLPRSTLHPNDETLNYEPAVSPILSGGYAWVIFASRRLYGDIATRAPFESDPREFDLTPTSGTGPTTKKLWVFAIDLTPTPGTDPSHPAFYLPSQELYAGNSRGFWVPDACKEAGGGCASGDECCGGFCYRRTEFDEPVCSDTPPPDMCKVKYVDEFGGETCFDTTVQGSCSREFDSCTADTDCCAGGGLKCIGARCALTLN